MKVQVERLGFFFVDLSYNREIFYDALNSMVQTRAIMVCTFL